jgi:hypothetical protein
MGGILVFNQVINGFIVHTQCMINYTSKFLVIEINNINYPLHC